MERNEKYGEYERKDKAIRELVQEVPPAGSRADLTEGLVNNLTPEKVPELTPWAKGLAKCPTVNKIHLKDSDGALNTVTTCG